MCAINDSLGQTHSHASIDHNSHLKIVLFSEILKRRTDRDTKCKCRDHYQLWLWVGHVDQFKVIRFPALKKSNLFRRKPAYTDRILHRCNSNNYEKFQLLLSQTKYQSYPDIKLSDHRPVSATFEITCFDAERKANISAYDPIIRFITPEKDWKVGEDAIVRYEIVQGESGYCSTWDWIGLFKVKKNSLDIVFPIVATIKLHFSKSYLVFLSKLSFVVKDRESFKYIIKLALMT